MIILSAKLNLQTLEFRYQSTSRGTVKNTIHHSTFRSQGEFLRGFLRAFAGLTGSIKLKNEATLKFSISHSSAHTFSTSTTAKWLFTELRRLTVSIPEKGRKLCLTQASTRIPTTGWLGSSSRLPATRSFWCKESTQTLRIAGRWR